MPPDARSEEAVLEVAGAAVDAEVQCFPHAAQLMDRGHGGLGEARLEDLGHEDLHLFVLAELLGHGQHDLPPSRRRKACANLLRAFREGGLPR